MRKFPEFFAHLVWLSGTRYWLKRSPKGPSHVAMLAALLEEEEMASSLPEAARAGDRRARQQDGADHLGATCKAGKLQSSGRSQSVSLADLRSSQV
jgi:hypothetical protein